LWIEEYFDCDDFAQVVFGVVGWHLKGVPFGIIWYSDGFYHAVNCFYSMEEKKMKMLSLKQTPSTISIKPSGRRGLS